MKNGHAQIANQLPKQNVRRQNIDLLAHHEQVCAKEAAHPLHMYSQFLTFF